MMTKTSSRLVIRVTLAIAAATLASTMWAQDAGTQSQPPSGDPAMQSQPQPGDQAQSQTDSAKTFAGKIVKQGNKYVLRDMANKVTYMLDAQDDLTPYVGKEVTVVGSLDAASNTIHVQKVQPPA